MSTIIRNYTDDTDISDDFKKVCDFLIRLNHDKVVAPNCLWARWVWQFGPNSSKIHSHIGIAEDNGTIVGLVTYDHVLGDAYFCIDPAYDYLKPQLINFAVKNLSLDGKLSMTLPDGDLTYQQAAVLEGFVPSNEGFSTARIDIKDIDYVLPEGYTIMSFADSRFDADKYFDAIWRGFDNTRERNEEELEYAKNRIGFDAPYLDLDLRILVVAPNGDYAAHCGMWCIPGSKYAYVEPVFTLPEYRKMRLGKAAVLEGVKRCGKLGAQQAYVLSSQQFYYNIGFYPVLHETWWEYKSDKKVVNKGL